MRKLNLNDLKVKSFVTDLSKEKDKTIVGGNKDRYESVVICDEPADTVGCGAETFAADIFGC